MLKSIAVFSLSFFLAFLILIVSIFRLAEVKYNVYGQSPSPTPESSTKEIDVSYNLPYTGNIKPDSFLWPIKALRDRVWVTMTINPAKKADLYLLFADKRLVDAKVLFEENKADLGLSVVTKAEKYLEMANKQIQIAKSQGMDTNEFYQKYATATLKHREILNEIIAIAPEDAKPFIIKNENYSINLFAEARNNLLSLGRTAPVNPFPEN